jgi:hypothetical protein
MKRPVLRSLARAALIAKIGIIDGFRATVGKGLRFSHSQTTYYVKYLLKIPIGQKRARRETVTAPKSMPKASAKAISAKVS